MNENLANEIRKTIESVKDMKIQVGGINNYLSILEGMIRADCQKQVDEAYQRGYNKGYADKTNNDEVCNELAKDIYQRGLNDAWEAARKIVLSPDEGGTSLTDIYVMFGNNGSMQHVFRSYLASEVIEKLKACEKKRKADNEIKVGDEVIEKLKACEKKRKADNEIKVGDEVIDADDDVYIVTYIYGEQFDGIYPQTGMCVEGSALTSAKKTGRHFDIDKILEEMRT